MTIAWVSHKLTRNEVCIQIDAQHYTLYGAVAVDVAVNSGDGDGVNVVFVGIAPGGTVACGGCWTDIRVFRVLSLAIHQRFVSRSNVCSPS